MKRRLSNQFQLRLPDGLRDRVRVAAETNDRSMNAEIVATLEEKYPAPVTGKDLLLEALRLVELRAGGNLTEAQWQLLSQDVRVFVVQLELAVANSGHYDLDSVSRPLLRSYAEGREAFIFREVDDHANPYPDPASEQHIAWAEGFELERSVHTEAARIRAEKHQD